MFSAPSSCVFLFGLLSFLFFSIFLDRCRGMIDAIYDDIKEGRKDDLPIDLDLPGQGQFYCVACAKYFRDEENLTRHGTSKQHKRQLKRLQEEPHRGEDLPRDC